MTNIARNIWQAVKCFHPLSNGLRKRPFELLSPISRFYVLRSVYMLPCDCFLLFPPTSSNTLSWCGGLCVFMNLRAVSSGAFILPAGAPKVNWSKARDQTKIWGSNFCFLSLTMPFFPSFSTSIDPYSCAVHSLLGAFAPTCLYNWKIVESTLSNNSLTHLWSGNGCSKREYFISYFIQY